MNQPEITDELLDRALAAYWGRHYSSTMAPSAIHSMRRAMRECLEAVISDLVAVADTHSDRIRLRKTLSGPAEMAQQVADDLKELLEGTP